MGLGGYDGSIRIDSSIDSKGFNAGISSMTGALGKLAAAVGIAFSAAAVIGFGKSAVDAASEMSSAFVGLKSILDGQGKSFAEAKKFVNDYVSDGLVPATNAITAYKSLAARGYDTDQIQKVMTALKNSAAFGRQSSLTMGQAVQSAAEGLKNENSILVDNAGVTKNVSVMWKDYATSIGTTADKLTKQQKILAEVNGILEETKFQSNDAAKYSETYAGKIAMLSQSFLNLKVAIGDSIIPVLAQMIPVITSAIKYFTVLFNTVSQYVQAWFGYDPSATVSALETSTEGAADAQNDLADATSKAGKAAKGALASFDELNVLQMADNTTPKGANAILAPAINTKQTTSAFDEIMAKVEAFKAALAEFFAPLQEPFAKLGAALQELGKTIWSGLQWVWTNILVPFGTWITQTLAPVFLELLTAAFKVLNSVLIALQPLGIWLWETFLKPLAEWTGGVILDALKWLTDRLNELSVWITNNQGAFRAIVLVFALFVAAILIVIAVVTTVISVITTLTSIGMALAGAITFILSPMFEVIVVITAIIVAIVSLIGIIAMLVFAWPQISQAASDTWDSIVKTWSVVAGWFNDTVITPIENNFVEFWSNLIKNALGALNGVITVWNAAPDLLAHIGNTIKTMFSELWESVKTKATGALDNVKSAWNNAPTWFNSTVITPIKNFFSEAWKNITGYFSSAWNSVKGVWTIVSTWFTKTVTDPIKNAFGTALDWIGAKWQSIFDGIVGFVKGSINAVIDVINGMIKGVIGGVNEIVRSLNTVGSVVPGWDNIPVIQSPQIPRLATGAVIPANSQFLAVLGDQRNGKNLEGPEEMFRRIVREESGDSGGGDITVTMPVYLDGEIIYKNQKKIQRRHGTNLITGRATA